MAELIKFNPTSNQASLCVDHPKPASECLPDWYKTASPFSTPKPQFDPVSGEPNTTLKMCMPFLDSLTTGYIQETWCDIFVEKKSDGTYFYYSSGPKIMSQRVSNTVFPKIEGFLEDHYTWHPAYAPETPKNYSVLITHPLNRQELPFHTLSGIIDSDRFTQSGAESNIPFLLKENFQGLIKKGTPMFQIIPIKRDSWQSIKTEYDSDKQLKIIDKVRQYFWNGYKKLYWDKKDYK